MRQPFPEMPAWETIVFADNVMLGTDTNASGYDGLRVAEVTEAIYKSLQIKSCAEVMSAK